MKVTLDVKLEAKDLYKFNIKQAYKGMQGILSLLLPLLFFAYAITSYGKASIGSIVLYVAVGIIFLLYVPISLWLRVNKTIKDENNALSKTLRYEFQEDLIRVTVGEENVEFKWENIYQMKTSGNLVLVYTNRKNAYILPKEQIGEKYEELLQLAQTKLDKYRIKMK